MRSCSIFSISYNFCESVYISGDLFHFMSSWYYIFANSIPNFCGFVEVPINPNNIQTQTLSSLGMTKKQKNCGGSARATPTVAETSTPMPDLKVLIHDHSLFFDKLVELIPAKFYLSQQDDVSDQPKAYFHGLSKAAKASLKRQSKQNLKLARRDRLDPEKIPQSSTLDLLKKSIQNWGENTETPVYNNEDGGTDVPNPINLEDQKSVTYEELREKLRRKIELLRGNRGEKPRETNMNKSNKKQGSENNEKERKRKRDDEETSEKGATSIEEIIEYGKVRLDDDQVDGERKKKRKMSKVKELERAKRLEEVKRENPKIAEKEWWKTATNRAMGVKVHDDPKLLREKMKKEKKRKEKHAEKWKERTETQEKAKKERQQKRKENIAGKIKENKMRKIAKREKKLMRPGFEGRKEGYITQD
ncbi:hypothetical protein M9H77_16798 [Catharanthus roseus]|uniref:Uncharacterized protein n=1 Tax=Catharanthus roseus TaxID=4058 RepID=A0ACC0B2T8_CATRO|nr:hypothetical protein M9H77_16798 [Catharanthus roseus]